MRDVALNAIQPRIDRISFRKMGFMTLDLADGRQIHVPLDRFPGIARLTPNQRRRYHMADGTVVLFHDDEDVYHIQDFWGPTKPTHISRRVSSRHVIWFPFNRFE